MPLRRIVFLSALVLAVAAVSPASALAAANGTNRPLSGDQTSILTFHFAGFTGSIEGTGQLSHLGRFTSHEDLGTFTISGANTFAYAGTATFVAANGDELFATTTASGSATALPPPVGSADQITTLYTITGGTGRFAAASGQFTSVTSGLIVVSDGVEVVSDDTSTITGRISY